MRSDDDRDQGGGKGHLPRSRSSRSGGRQVGVTYGHDPPHSERDHGPYYGQEVGLIPQADGEHQRALAELNDGQNREENCRESQNGRRATPAEE